MNESVELLRNFFDQYGYWTVFVALLLENAGVPVPGETVLLFASFLAFDEQELRLRYIIMVGIAAATLGDNLGYWLGRKGGRPLLQKYMHLFRIPESVIEKGEAGGAEMLRVGGEVHLAADDAGFGLKCTISTIAKPVQDRVEIGHHENCRARVAGESLS